MEQEEKGSRENLGKWSILWIICYLSFGRFISWKKLDLGVVDMRSGVQISNEMSRQPAAIS